MVNAHQLARAFVPEHAAEGGWDAYGAADIGPESDHRRSRADLTYHEAGITDRSDGNQLINK